jgi:hypothetical protein
MLIALLLALQAAPAAPDIELDIRANVREVRIERRGETSLELRAVPDGGTQVDVDRPEAAGRRRLRNVSVRVKAEARIADPFANSPPPETASPQ